MFYKPENLDRNLKATVHKTGKLGFTSEAAKKMGLSDEKSIRIARNEADETDENLYIIVNERKEEGSFSVNKAGEYYYINTKALFDAFNWDYENDRISFEISVSEYEGRDLFVFKTKRKAKKVKEKPQ